MEEVDKALTGAETTDWYIQKYPEFMAYFYDKKLTGSENLTQNDALDTDRLKWAQNKKKAEALIGQK